VRLLKGGHSIHNAAKIAGKGVSTVWRVKLALKAERHGPFTFVVDSTRARARILTHSSTVSLLH